MSVGRYVRDMKVERLADWVGDDVREGCLASLEGDDMRAGCLASFGQ